MKYSALYQISEEYMASRHKDGKRPIIPVRMLSAKISRNVNWLDRVRFYPIDCQEGDPIGHYECIAGQDAAYDAENAWMATITYDSSLNVCWSRLVWCKELMHVFDTEDGQINSSEKYSGFLEEIELEPLNPTESYISENNAKWMALMLLCPKSERDQLLRNGHTMSEYEIALQSVLVSRKTVSRAIQMKTIFQLLMWSVKT